MAGAIEIRLDTRKLDLLRGSLESRAEAVLDKAAHDVEAGAKEMAPVDTGALKNSIGVEKASKRLERIIRVGVEYGIYQEFGTSRMGAQPFLTPAVERVRKGLVKAWEALFR